MLSRKDYVAIAGIVSEHIYDLNDAGIALVSELADFLQMDNPNFNRERFVDACCWVHPNPRTNERRRSAVVRLSADNREGF